MVSRPLDYYKFLEVVLRKIIPITDAHLVTIKKIEGMRKWAEEYKELLEFIRYQDVQNFETVCYFEIIYIGVECTISWWYLF